MSQTHEGSSTGNGTGHSHRGFAAMDAEKQKEIASKGGRAAHQKGTAHEFTSAEARAAGRKGGYSVSQDRAHMAEIGRQGGRARGQRHHAAQQEKQEQQVAQTQNLQADQQNLEAKSEASVDETLQHLESLEPLPGLPQ